MQALRLAFALEDLRAGFGHFAAPGADPRHDAAPFRAFRAALLDAAAGLAAEEARLSMWWEGTYNGYRLVVQAVPSDAVPGLAGAAGEICPLESAVLGAPRQDGHPLARVVPGHAAIARDGEGNAFEAPFGEATGHFGAPGVKRVRD